MSLINQMLRDLETRRAAERRQQGGAIFTGLTSGNMTAAHPRWLPMLAAGVIGLLLILVAYLAWQRFMATDAVPPAASVAAAAQTTAPQPMPTPTQPAEPGAVPLPAAAPVAQAPATPVGMPPAASAIASSPAPETDTAVAVTAPPPRKEPEPAAEPVVIEKTLRPLSLAQQADKTYQQAIGDLRAGNNAAAESALREALRLDHEHLQARETLGAMLLGAGRVVEAAQILEAGRRFFSRRPTLALLMARIQVEQGDPSAAITTLEQNLAAGTARGDYLAFLAALYQRVLRYNDSITAYQQALAIEPGQGSWWAGLAISLENAGRSEAALAAYRRAAASALPPQLARYVRERQQALAHD